MVAQHRLTLTRFGARCPSVEPGAVEQGAAAPRVDELTEELRSMKRQKTALAAEVVESNKRLAEMEEQFADADRRETAMRDRIQVGSDTRF